MKKTLVMVGSAALLLGAGCRVYEGDAATKKIGGIAQRNNEDRAKARDRGDLIRTRVENAAPERAERIIGYLTRRANEPDAKLEKQAERIAEWRQSGRDLANPRRDHAITDIDADMVVEGTVAKVLGDEVHVVNNDGQSIVFKAVTGSHVVVDNREIAAAALPVGFPVKATYGSLEGSNYYYSVEALTDQ